MYPTLMTKNAAALKVAWSVETERILHDMQQMGKASPEALEVVRGFLAAPGKLIRPSLFLFGYEAYTKRAASEKIVRLAVSLELLHMYLLIHDDIVDNSTTRRGVPSLHTQFALHHKRHGLRGSSEHFGVSMAILIGDILCTTAESIWTSLGQGGATNETARGIFETMKKEVGWGQYNDATLSVSRHEPSYAEVLRVLVEKSGKYSIFRPLQLGACIAGAGNDATLWMEGFGTNLGVAFQTIDDILGTFGNEKETGKPIDSDLIERKYTLLIHFAFKCADAEDLETLKQFFGYAPLTGKTLPSVDAVRQLLKKYDADDKARVVALEHLEKAKAALLDSGLDSSYTDELRAFADFIVTRKK